MASADVALPDGYHQTLDALKQRVHQAQAQRTVNTELIQLYWSIGREILTRQEQWGWGGKTIARPVSRKICERRFRKCEASPLGTCNT